jgi:small subunit ribosomal protein S9|tara:strand:- start:700 stop:1101 length:402 start_codon:yes stop_codon:yes gene_type:complete
MKIIQAMGKRKNSIAKVTIKQGNGKVRINKILIDNYQPRLSRLKVKEPLLIAGNVIDKIQVDVNVNGGGTSSQAEASRLGIAKALVEFTKSEKLKDQFLKYDRNLLVADVRRKETRKPNRHGKARAKRQKSYR